MNQSEPSQMMLSQTETTPAKPQIIFFTEPARGARLLETLQQPGVLSILAATGAGVAIALTEFDQNHAEATRLLNARGIPVVAWLCLPIAEGLALNMANYPRAQSRYHSMRLWAADEQLHFMAIGLGIEPPSDDTGDWSTWRAIRSFARGLWLARDNALYPSAQAAYIELMATIRHDGYEVHTYQLPFVADDRRAGTTLMQRAFDIVDIPSDVDVLLCGSSVPIDWLNGDIGGALIASYGPEADAIGVGAIDLDAADEPGLPWRAIRRDLLLAAEHTDTIYMASLEFCSRQQLLPAIASLDWGDTAKPRMGRRVLVGSTRSIIFLLLVVGRYGRSIVAWVGWILAILLWLQLRRSRQQTKRH